MWVVLRQAWLKRRSCAVVLMPSLDACAQRHVVGQCPVGHAGRAAADGLARDMNSGVYVCVTVNVPESDDVQFCVRRMLNSSTRRISEFSLISEMNIFLRRICEKNNA